jgi:hypothetical protein
MPQLSAAVTVAVKSGNATVPVAPTESVCAGAQAAIVGTRMSRTVKFATQVAVLPAASVTVMVTGCTPGASNDPATGDCVRVVAQSSVATTEERKSGKLATQFVLALAMKSGAQSVITGAVVSTTVTTTTQVEVLLYASLTVKVTLCVPRANEVPATGDCVTVTAVQLSVAETRPVKLGSNTTQPTPASYVCGAAHEAIVGAVISTPSINVAVAVACVPFASVTVTT